MRIIFILLICFNINAQEINFGFDPAALDEGIDLTLSVNSDETIFNETFIVGVSIEYFESIKYISYHATLDYPFNITRDENIEFRMGLEYGRIIRYGLPTHLSYPEEGGNRAHHFNTYGANGTASYSLSDSFAIYSTFNYKYRGDSVALWKESATKYEYSVRIGIRYNWK